MKWKAASHTEAEKILRRVAKSGIRVLDELDMHVEVHSASNDISFEKSSDQDSTPGLAKVINCLQCGDSATDEVVEEKEEKEAASR